MARTFVGPTTSDRLYDSSYKTSSAQRTTMIWARYATAVNLGRLWHKYAGSGGTSDLEEFAYSDTALTKWTIERAFGASTTRRAYEITMPSTNTWHCYIVVHDVSALNEPVVYLDGVAQTLTTRDIGTPSGAGILNSFDGYYIGNRDLNDRAWNGELAHFAVWDALLTANEAWMLAKGTPPSVIRQNSLRVWVPMSGYSPETSFAGTVSGASWSVTGTTVTDSSQDPPVTFSLPKTYKSTILADSPIAYYRFQEASGNPQDSSGNGNHVTTVTGTPTYRSASVLNSDPDDYSINLDTRGDFLSVPHNSSLNYGDVTTHEFWAKHGDTDTSLQVVIAKVAGLSVSFLSGNFACGKADVGFLRWTTANAFSNDTTNWHYYAVTKNGNTVKMYYDGEEVNTLYQSDYTLVNNTNDLTIGHEAGSFGYRGLLDEVAIYNTELSAARIKLHYLERFQRPWISGQIK